MEEQMMEKKEDDYFSLFFFSRYLLFSLLQTKPSRPTWDEREKSRGTTQLTAEAVACVPR
ncbi:MAG: hypothetical protein Fur0035_02290 [Anaerolineales bacterium]